MDNVLPVQLSPLSYVTYASHHDTIFFLGFLCSLHASLPRGAVPCEGAECGDPVSFCVISILARLGVYPFLSVQSCSALSLVQRSALFSGSLSFSVSGVFFVFFWFGFVFRIAFDSYYVFLFIASQSHFGLVGSVLFCDIGVFYRGNGKWCAFLFLLPVSYKPTGSACVVRRMKMGRLGFSYHGTHAQDTTRSSPGAYRRALLRSSMRVW